MLPFDTTEYKARLVRTKERIAGSGLDVLLVTDQANMNYLTGYDGWSFYVHQMLVVGLDWDEPIWIGRAMDANGAKMTTWLREENIVGYQDDYVQSVVKHPMSLVAGVLKERKAGGKKIGAEMDTYFFTARCLAELKKNLPNVVFADATNLVNQVRMVKSEQEIRYMKRAAMLAEKAMQAAVDSVRPGVRQCDAVANIYHAQIAGTNEFGGDYPAIVPLVLAGEGASAAHLTWSDKEFQENEVVILELAGCYHRYHSPLCRTIYTGNPPEKLRWMADKAVEALEKALEVIKPGLTCEEVDKIWRKWAITESGITNESAYHRLGYAVGLGYPPDWGEHTASMRPGDKTVLQPNMTFHLIPSVWAKDYAFGISECIRVTQEGCEVLAKFPRRLLA